MNKDAFILIFLPLLIVFTLLPAQNLNPTEQLGKNIFFDKISSPQWMSCATCHAPETGFTGPNPGTNLQTAVYRGAVPKRFGNRKPPSAAYATLSPVFYYDEGEGLFVGGNFWDGRATGEHLDNPAADQALGPFLNPVEQNNASKADVLMQIADAKYTDLWEIVWGEPIGYATPEEIEINYDRVGLSIAAYENSNEVNSFTSKYDYYLAGTVELTEQETWGLDLFEGKGLCALCHLSNPDDQDPPLFTDFTFDNLGVPKNPGNPFYDMDQVFLDDGSPINPLGDSWIDPGLGGFLANHPDPAFQEMASENMGKHKVPTLRNVAKAPSDKYIKAYMHNGVFKSLEEVVHFYNTRDVEDWPPAEVSANVNLDELGDLGLTPEEEEAIVAFMKTLSDGYDPEKDKVKDKIHTNLKITGANPFNPTTQFTYSLAEASDIQIHVYNTIGQKVATLVNSYQPAGTYQVDFNAAQMASGVYFVRLSTKNTVATQKVSLIK
jgi:cytochrome c peroxidase